MLTQTMPLRLQNLPLTQKRVVRSKNLFLNALPDEVYNRLKLNLEFVHLKPGAFISKPDEPVQYVYFPENTVISMVRNLENGTTIETAVIGNEGVSGIAAILRDELSSEELIIQGPTGCLRTKAEFFRAEFQRSIEFNQSALRFVFALMTQISNNLACTHLHRIENRLARWLLSLNDRIDSNKLYITQDFIAQLLGVHRQPVSQAACKMQKEGVICYSRGKMTILDRNGLEDISCECYQATKRAYVKYLNC